MTKCPHCLRIGCNDAVDCRTFKETLPCVIFFSEKSTILSGDYCNYVTKDGESFAGTAFYTYEEEKGNDAKLYGYLWEDAKFVTILKNGRASIAEASGHRIVPKFSLERKLDFGKPNLRHNYDNFAIDDERSFYKNATLASFEKKEINYDKMS